jgi:hypothetical protein
MWDAGYRMHRQCSSLLSLLHELTTIFAYTAVTVLHVLADALAPPDVLHHLALAHTYVALT